MAIVEEAGTIVVEVKAIEEEALECVEEVEDVE